MKKLFLAGITVVALNAGGSALAADLPVKARPLPPPVVVNDWSGFYIGAHAGWGWARDPFTAEFSGTLFLPGVVISEDKLNGFVAGFQAGYNQQWGNWVGGLEIDLSGTGIKGTTSVSATKTPNISVICDPGQPCFAPLGTQAVSVHDKIDLLGSARARLGFLPWPNLLVYGTGGLAWVHFVRDITVTQHQEHGAFFESFTRTNSNSSWRFGWAAGVGGETRVFNNWLFRIEYLHYDFGKSDSSQFSGVIVHDFGETDPTSLTGGRFTIDVVRAGLSYKFGGGPASF